MNNIIENTKVGLITETIVSVIAVLWFLLSPSSGPLLPGHTGNNVVCFVISTFLTAILGGAISGSLI